MYTLLLQAVAATGDELTFGEIISGIPHDAPAFVIYTLTAVAVGWVVWANRKKS